MNETIAETRIAEMQAKGYKLVGKTSGTYSFRKGSKLSQKLDNLNLTKDTCEVRAGAYSGKYKTEGYELLIFVKS